MSSLSASSSQSWSLPKSADMHAVMYDPDARISLFIRLCGVIVALTGIVVLYGWLTQNALIVQIRPDYSPMKFNTSLCLALTGISLLASQSGLRRLSFLLILAGSLLPLGTLFEYVFHLDAVIDNLFMSPFIQAPVRHAGRMAPNTMAALLLTDSAVVMYLYGRFFKHSEFMLAIMGSAVAALGIVPLIGYMGGIQAAHTWGDFAGMALHTALCFVILGNAIVACAWKRTTLLPNWLPIPVAISLIIIALSLWIAVREYENIRFEQGLQREATYAAGRSNDRLTSYYAAVDRIARRWTMMNGTPRALWEDDAQAYLKGYSFLKTVEWVDASGTVQWIVPQAGNEKLQGEQLNKEGTRAETMRRALETMQGQLSEPVDLIQGGRGFLYMSPVTAQGKYDGVIVTAFTLDDVFNRILARSSIGAFYMTVSQNNVVFFSNTPADFVPKERWQKSITVTNKDKTWTITVNPSPEMLATQHSPLPHLVLITGLLTALFASFAILLAIHARRAAIILKRSEDKIKQIVANHSILASADFNLEMFMKEIVNSLQNLTPATGAVIEIIDEEDMVYQATAGSIAAFQGMRMKRIGSMSGRCVGLRETFVSQDTSKDPYVNIEACRKVGAASMALAPLIQRGNVVGVLKIVSSKTHAFDTQDIQTLQLMAGLMGGAMGQQMEIERREKLEEQLRYMAHNDLLTSLPNRMLFMDRLSHAILNNARAGGVMAVMYMDIDHFKSINDTYGHAEGDALLSQFSARISQALRKGDTLARLGGDEFTVIAENLKKPEDAQIVAQKIIDAAREPFVLPTVTLNISVSIGIAVAKHTVAPDVLIARADAALYESKRGGRNGFTVSKEEA